MHVSYMGHAEYVSEGTDYVDNRGSFFKSLEDKLDNPDMVHMNGTYISFISGPLEIYGLDDLLLAMGLYPEKFALTAERYAKWMMPIYEALADCESPVIMLHDNIVGCGFAGFVMEPMTDMKYIAEKYGKTHSFIGNADTRILLSGTKEEIRAEVQRCMDIGKKCPGFIMSVEECTL